jgi:hypothetical protein
MRTEETKTDGSERQPYSTGAPLNTRPWVRREIIIAAGGMVLAIVGAIFSPLWLVAASTTVVAGSLLALVVNAVSVPRSYRKMVRFVGRE